MWVCIPLQPLEAKFGDNSFLVLHDCTYKYFMKINTFRKRKRCTLAPHQYGVTSNYQRLICLLQACNSQSQTWFVIFLFMSNVYKKKWEMFCVNFWICNLVKVYTSSYCQKTALHSFYTKVSLEFKYTDLLLSIQEIVFYKGTYCLKKVIVSKFHF